MKIRTVIVDDEALARRRIRSLLLTQPEIDLVGECSDGRSAVSMIAELKPDLVFLDVQMPEQDGFGVLNEISSVHLPLVIFVTAYDRYAVKAFDSHAVDYLLKPFKRERFFEAIERAKEHVRYGRTDNYEEKIAHLLRQLKPGNDRLIVKSSGRLLFLRTDEIDWVEAAANYCCLRVGSEAHEIREKISSIEQRLDPQKFLRIHRSLIVNLDRVRELQPCGAGEYVVVLRSGKELPLGRSYRARIESVLAPL